MLNLILGFIVGLVVMDFLWAWKLGLPQKIWLVRRRKPNEEQEEDFW